MNFFIFIDVNIVLEYFDSRFQDYSTHYFLIAMMGILFQKMFMLKLMTIYFMMSKNN